MRMRFGFFIQRFKKRRFNIPLASLSTLWSVLRWGAKGITDEVVFGNLLGRGGNEVGDSNVMEYFAGHPQAILLTLVGLAIAGVLVWMYLDARKEYRSTNLIDTLNEMHGLMLRHTSGRLFRRVKKKTVEEQVPIILNRLGVISIEEWPKFLARAKRRTKAARGRGEKPNRDWYYRVLQVTSDLKEELTPERVWTVVEGKTIGKWLDDNNWGVGSVRSLNGEWDRRYKSLRQYLLDPVLNRLVREHIDVSYVGASVLRMANDSAKWPKAGLAKLLYGALIDRIDRLDTEPELQKILISIHRRQVSSGQRQEAVE